MSKVKKKKQVKATKEKFFRALANKQNERHSATASNEAPLAPGEAGRILQNISNSDSVSDTIMPSEEGSDTSQATGSSEMKSASQSSSEGQEKQPDKPSSIGTLPEVPNSDAGPQKSGDSWSSSLAVIARGMLNKPPGFMSQGENQSIDQSNTEMQGEPLKTGAIQHNVEEQPMNSSSNDAEQKDPKTDSTASSAADKYSPRKTEDNKQGNSNPRNSLKPEDSEQADSGGKQEYTPVFITSQGNANPDQESKGDEQNHFKATQDNAASEKSREGQGDKDDPTKSSMFGKSNSEQVTGSANRHEKRYHTREAAQEKDAVSTQKSENPSYSDVAKRNASAQQKNEDSTECTDKRYDFRPRQPQKPRIFPEVPDMDVDNLDGITVTFHAVIGPSVIKWLRERSGKLCVVSELDWRVPVVIMSEADVPYKKLNGHRYMKGSLVLPQGKKNLKYKYVVCNYSGEPQYEILDTWDTNRWLNLPSVAKDFNRYDDIVTIFIPAKLNRRLASDIFLSTIDARFLKQYGLAEAFKLKDVVLRSHMSYEHFVFCHEDRRYKYSDLYSQREVEQFMLSNALESFNAQKMDYQKLDNFFLLIAYIFLLVKKSKFLEIQSNETYYELFETLKELLPKVKAHNQIDAFLPGVELKLNMKQALFDGASNFIHTFYGTSDKIDLFSRSWLSVLPYIVMLDPEESVCNIDRLKHWRSFSELKDVNLVAGLPPEQLQTFFIPERKGVIEEALLAIVSDAEMRYIMKNTSANWLCNFPMKALLRRVIDVVVMPQGFNELINQGFQANFEDAVALQLAASGKTTDAFEISPEDIMYMYKELKCNANRRWDALMLFLQVLEVFLANGYELSCVQAVAQEIIADLCNNLKQQRNSGRALWMQLAEKADAFGFLSLVQTTFSKYLDHCPFEKLLDFYSSWTDAEKNPLFDIILDKTVAALVKQVEAQRLEGRVTKFFKSFMGRSENQKAVSLISSFIMRSLPASLPPEKTVSLCKNRAMANVFGLVGDYAKDFSEPIKDRLRAAATGISNLLDDFRQGKWDIAFYRDFQKNEAFENLWELHSGLEQFGSFKIAKPQDAYILDLGVSVTQYLEAKDIANDFISCCQGEEFVMIDRGSFPRLRNNANVKLTQISHDPYQILQLKMDDLEVLQWFAGRYKQSTIFPALWVSSLSELLEKEEKAPVPEVIEDEDSSDGESYHPFAPVDSDDKDLNWEELKSALPQVKANIEALLKKIKGKDVSVGYFEKLMEPVCESNVKKELKILGIADVAHQALYLKRYRTLKDAVTAASDMQDLLQLGPFEEIQDIKASLQDDKTFSEKQLGQLSEKMLQQGARFSKLDRPKVELICQLNKCRDIVHWLQSSIKSNQELKVFLDLASISAGETDYEVDRLMAFQAAVSGFAPLLFDLSRHCSMDDMMDALEKVFKNAEQRADIGNLIVEANGFLPWIKDVSERHGSVEGASLNMVQNIQSTGHITLTCQNPKTRQRWSDFTEAISLKYRIPDQTSTDSTPSRPGDIRLLEHAELDELRSKLMLITVSEECKLAVDAYMRILTSVEVIAKKLTALLDAGCHLFSELKLDFHFDEDKKVKMRLDFGHKSSIINSREPLEDCLGYMTEFLHNVSSEWEQYVSGLRQKRPSLNFFITEQLVRLSSYFAEVIHSPDIEPDLPIEALMMIKMACPKFPENKLYQEIKMSYDRAVGLGYGDDSDGATDSDDEDSRIIGLAPLRSRPEELREHSSFKRLVRNLGISENVALACLVHFRNTHTDIEEMETWCLNNEDLDDDELEEIINSAEVPDLEQEQQNSIPEEEPERIAVAASDPPRQNTLKSDLNDHWAAFQDENTSSLRAKDYIPLKVLAECLEELVERYQSIPNRTFPQYLTKGRPNLILCSEKESHKAALMVYQASPSAPRPALSEMIICSKQTTKEQVDLLCRRALQDNTGKIFTILHAHLLSFEISVHLEELLSEQTSPYQILFLANKDVDSHHSYMITAFEKFIVSAPSILQDRVLEEYIEKCLLANEKQSDHPDPECSRLRIVASEEYGNGKSLVVKELAKNSQISSHLSLDEQDIDMAEIIRTWTADYPDVDDFTVYHIDATLTSDLSRNNLLFSLAILGGIIDHKGGLWVCSDYDVIMAELTCKKSKEKPFYKLLPTIHCNSPKDVLNYLNNMANSGQDENGMTDFHKDKIRGWISLMNKDVFSSNVVQRPYQYLSLANDSKKLDQFTYCGPKEEDYVADCLQTLLQHCPMENPTWTELMHFTSFLDAQLTTTEQSVFCNTELMGDDLPGFKSFVIRFLLQMAKDFATRSVVISDESHGEGFLKPVIEERRQWEKSPHPYIFFNEDNTLSFYGLFFDRDLSLVDERTGRILQRKAIPGYLYHGLRTQGVQFNQDFHAQTRREKLINLCRVIDVEYNDPDPNYELTYDNVMKMLAIFMRFRSNIPVVIMGETGSGKTTLIKFMCELQKKNKTDTRNMIIMKIHGGTTKTDIHKVVANAINVARINFKAKIRQTVLFFDEANTTTAISTIKNIMCDKISNGKPIPSNIGLQFVAAVNPYRKHSDEMIKKLETAGLGYHIQSNETTDRLGNIPMRRLVYRVQEIPQSMFPLVWDFGSLDTATEKLYIRQMVQNWIQENNTGMHHLKLLESSLSAAQKFMREQNDECSFVSLRDVNRCLLVLQWFERHTRSVYDDFPFARKDGVQHNDVPSLEANLVLALGVAYYVRLQDGRDKFAQTMAQVFSSRFMKPQLFKLLINKCQDLFINELKLDRNIAKNTALKENVWMMVLCIELRIPLFLVGKPGSSKSLAKTVVNDAMLGKASYSPFFKKLKDTHMISFQCSPIATAGGILGTFKQCQKFQKDMKLDEFSAVVVLDEVGLAEDSEKMPLKTLHPLLEDGCVDESPEPYKKVAFIGISNWALDPAKMNRGIFVSRGEPSEADLQKSAEGICRRDDNASKLMQSVIPKLTKGYYQLYKKQEREYFGLRDFYSLIKSVLSVVNQTGSAPTHQELVQAIQRNFGGYFGDFDPVKFFLETIEITATTEKKMDSKDIIMEAIKGDSKDARYILLLTKNNAALRILQEKNLMSKELKITKTHVMFGSSFPNDKEYTQICANINKIKIAMELGHTVVLCNLNNLYESLYDALNQNYVMLGGKRYVDLGLGTHRVKCRVHDDFRLIVVAEDKEVYQKFPIPLINRLEKHFLGMETMLEEEHVELVHELKRWVGDFCELKEILLNKERKTQLTPGDVFIGYHSDIIAAAILHYVSSGRTDRLEESVKEFLLSCTTPDAIMRLPETRLPAENQEQYFETYYLNQSHNSLASMLQNAPESEKLLQVTTSSRLLTSAGKNELEGKLGLPKNSTSLLTLQQFDSELNFEKHVKEFLTKLSVNNEQECLLLVQSDVSTEESCKLVECARYVTQNMAQEYGQDKKFRVVFIIHVPHVVGGVFTGMTIHPWLSFHIDELREENVPVGIRRLSEEHDLKSAFDAGLIDLDQLLLDTLPKASSCIEEWPERVQERLDILIHEWKRGKCSDGVSIKDVIRKLVVGQLKQKELKKWLLDIAIRSPHLKEGNTFQRSVWLHLQDEVLAPLKHVIEICDISSGLNLITEQSVASTFVDFLQVLKVDNDNSRFKAIQRIEGKFPFSHVILAELENLQRETTKDNPVQLQMALQDSYLAKPLLIQFHREGAMMRFLPDLVQLSLPSKFETNTLNVLCETVYIESMKCHKERLKQDNEDDPAQWKFISPADSFKALQKLKPRLMVLIEILKFEPQLADACEELFRTHDINFNLDVLLFQKVLEKHAPLAERLRSKDEMNGWSQKLLKIDSLFHSLKSTVPEDDLIMENVGKLIQKCKIIRLFLQHTATTKFRPTTPMLKRMAMQLKDNTLKSVDDFKKLIKLLQFANTQSIKEHFLDGSDACIICEEGFDASDAKPVALPCRKHIGCKMCLEDHFYTKSGQWTCPGKGCLTEVDKEFEFKSTLECEEEVKSHQEFKKHLQFFFLDVLQQFTYANGTPDTEVTKLIMSYIVTSKLPKDKEAKRKIRTKGASPFENHAIDASPVVRSFLLQLLLQDTNFEQATSSLQHFLEQQSYLKLNDREHEELYLLVVFCLEDRLTQDLELDITGRHTTINEDECYKLLVKYRNREPEDKVESLIKVAEMRLCIQKVAALLHDLISGTLQISPDRADKVLTLATEVLGKNEDAQSFLIRALVGTYSTGIVREWAACGQFRKLMPRELQTASFDSTVDYFNIVGDSYVAAKIHLRAALLGDCHGLLEYLGGTPNVIRTGFNLALCFLTEIEKTRTENHAELVERLTPQNPELARAMTKHFKIRDALWDAFPSKRELQKSIICLLYYLKYTLGLLPRGNNLQESLKNITKQKLFPTMEQDDSAEIMQMLVGNKQVTKVYRCYECRTPYGVADCGVPVPNARHAGGEGSCPHCGSRLGGSSYGVFHGTGLGIQQIEHTVITDATKDGHILGAPAGFVTSKPERDLDEVQVALTRFVLHAALAIQIPHSEDRVVRCIDPTPEASVADFLMTHMQLNVEQLCRSLGKNDSEVMVLLFNVVKRLTSLGPRNNNPQATLTTKQGRRAWEADFAKSVLSPEQNALDASVIRFNEAHRASTSAAEDILTRIASGRGADGQSQMWYPREKLNIASLEHKMGRENIRAKCPNLFRFLEHREVIVHVKQLPQLLRLQNSLIKTFGHKLESPIVENQTIERFMAEADLSDAEKGILKELVQMYISVFNSLKSFVFDCGSKGLEARDFLRGDSLSYESSSAAVLFASDHQAGQCFMALLEVLVEKQNHLLGLYAGDNDLALPPKLSCSEILDSDKLLVYDEKELTLMLVAHSDYHLEIEGSGKTKWNLNEDGVETGLVDRYFVGRSPVDANTFPQFHYRNEVIKHAPLCEKIDQEPLTEKQRYHVRKELSELRDVGDLLDKLRITQAILVRTEKHDPEASLLNKMTSLNVASEYGERALIGLGLKHLDSLLGYLTLLRARWMLKNKHDPFNTIAQQYHEHIPEGCVDLKPLRDSPDLGSILFVLHLFINDRLRATADGKKAEVGLDPPGQKLAEYFAAYLDAIDDPNPYEKAAMIDDKLNNAHAIALFVIMVDRYIPM